MAPAEPGKERAEAATDEIGCHKDSVGTVAGLRYLLYASALVAQLLTLHPYIHDDDRGYQSDIGIPEQETDGPCKDL